jgi:ADP-ribose pyrophosphatase
VVGEQALLELPAGKLNGGEVLDTAKRELREEIGKSAATWRHLMSFYASPGFTDELIHAFLATDLRDDPLASGENERIEIVAEPLERLERVIGECRDSKSLVTMVWFRAFVLADQGGRTRE